MQIVRSRPWWYVLVALALGLAPVTPMPHFFEKLIWLSEGRLHRPLDIFDLCFHGLGWVFVVSKLGIAGYDLLRARKGEA